MIRRLFYHSFWNFYDYLGTWLLLGTIQIGMLALVALVPSYLGNLVQLPPSARLLVVVVQGLLLLLTTAASFAGSFVFATRAARDEPARLPHFRDGVRRLTGIYLRLLLSGLLLFGVVYSNIWFYGQIATSSKDAGLRIALLGLSTLFLWVFAGLCLLGFCALAVPARYPEENRMISCFRRAFVFFAVSPTLWIAVTILFVLTLAVSVVSVIGVVFLVPMLTVLSTTALEIESRLVDDLARSRQLLGEGLPLKAYKSKALELGWEWEHRQPRRTLRELIRPWEH